MECVRVNINWKVLHSRWTVLLQLEWSVLQWTLCRRYFTAGGQWYPCLNEMLYSEYYCEILDNRYSKFTTNYLSYLKFELEDFTWRLLCNAYLKCIAGRVTFLYPSFPMSIFLSSHKNRPNSKPHIFSTRIKLSIFEFTEGRKCKHSMRIHVHSFILLSTFEILHWKCIGLKICFQFWRNYCSKSSFGWTITIFKSRGRWIREDVNGILMVC